jgi:hypothetical protein
MNDIPRTISQLRSLADYVAREQSRGVDISLSDAEAELIVAALRVSPPSPASFAEAADPDKGSVAAQHERGEPVAWRWRPRGMINWIYDPTAEWRSQQKGADIDIEPLYTAPVAAQRERYLEESKEWSLACTLAGAELNYRDSYERRGADHIETGIRWDKMRRAGDEIRSHEPSSFPVPDAIWQAAEACLNSGAPRDSVNVLTATVVDRAAVIEDEEIADMICQGKCLHPDGRCVCPEVAWCIQIAAKIRRAIADTKGDKSEVS